jgi:hypothetical protein
MHSARWIALVTSLLTLADARSASAAPKVVQLDACVPRFVVPVLSGYWPELRSGVAIATGIGTTWTGLGAMDLATGTLVDLTFAPPGWTHDSAQFVDDQTIVYLAWRPIGQYRAHVRALSFGADGLPGTGDDVDWLIDGPPGPDYALSPRVQAGEVVWSRLGVSAEIRGCDFNAGSSYQCAQSTFWSMPDPGGGWGNPLPVPGGSFVVPSPNGTLWQDPGQTAQRWHVNTVYDLEFPFIATWSLAGWDVRVATNPATPPLFNLPPGSWWNLSRLPGSNGGIRAVAQGTVVDWLGGPLVSASLTYPSAYPAVEGDVVVYTNWMAPWVTMNLVVEDCVF